METQITKAVIAGFERQLEEHPIYEAVSGIEDLRCFMEHHIYSVWDFMSLIKYLQSVVAPSAFPWVPTGDANIRRFINELVLEEESDESAVPGSFSSHFELYQTAMREIGADCGPSTDFVNRVAAEGVDRALSLPVVPAPSRLFTTTTFEFIASDRPHCVAAALALGREHIIPCMFRSILDKIGVSSEQAPVFHLYLNRHIHLDEDFHAPLSLRLLNELCAGNADRVSEAVTAAEQAVSARIQFWDGVLDAIQSGHSTAVATSY